MFGIELSVVLYTTDRCHPLFHQLNKFKKTICKLLRTYVSQLNVNQYRF